MAMANRAKKSGDHLKGINGWKWEYPGRWDFMDS